MPEPARYYSHARLELSPDDRIGAQRFGAGRRVRRIALLGLVTLGGAWLLSGENSDWRNWPAALIDVASSIEKQSTALMQSFGKSTYPAQRSTDQPLPAESNQQQSALDTPTHEELAAAPETAVIVYPEAGSESRDTKPSVAPNPIQAYAAPPPPVRDPLEVRATEAGLHPDITRALLARLSPADFQNAAIAIKTALAETPDDAVHTWPLRRAGGIAQFQVHFVAGAPTDCRRYVVTIAKDGWLTTALPLERCGLPPVRPRKS